MICEPITRPVRPRSESHLRWIRTLPCLATGSPVGVVAHHLQHAYPSALSARSGDDAAVPILNSLHDAQYPGSIHAPGCREAEWWTSRGIDALYVAHRLWAVSIFVGRVHAKRVDIGAARILAVGWEDWICRGYPVGRSWQES